MLRKSLATLGIAIAAAVCLDGVYAAEKKTSAAQTAVAAPAVPAMAAADQRALLDKYCITCHSDRMKAGGLVLEKSKVDVENLPARADVWEKVVRKLHSGTMPPSGRPRPDKATLAAFMGSIEGTLDRAANAAPNPGRPAIHRLNRVEYVNAIRDLLALEIDGKALLPADDSGYGFDNIADVLTVSPGLLDRYLSVARKIARLAIGDASTKPLIETVARLPVFLLQDDRMHDELPFGTRGGLVARHNFPVDGDYTIKVFLQRGTMSGAVRGRTEDNQVDVRVDGARVKMIFVPKMAPRGYEVADTSGPLEVPLTVTAGPHTIAVGLLKGTTMVEGWGPSRFPVGSTSFAQVDRTSQDGGIIDMGIDSVQVEGPFNGRMPEDTAARRAIFSCRPPSLAAPAGKSARASEEDACAKSILSRLAYRAYRRPVTADDVTVLMGFYKQGRSEGTFDKGIQFALERLLVAPDFLFRVEGSGAGVKPGTVHQLTDFEIASRLSFFLWSSLPDVELLDAASKGRLKDPVVLEKQIARMLGDDRAGALLTNFFGQWLYTRNVQSMVPDPTIYPEFDDNLRAAFEQETALFLRSQLAEDRSVLELLTSNYTFVNERLAKHYGIPNIYGSHFRRITLPDDRRGGLLGQGSILLVTSYATRTSPVLRGKWLMQNILGTPPPPPPPDVPPFEATKIEGTLRQRMETHRKNPVCATCHSQIDPLGFALENFDGIGKYRALDGRAPVDASGVLPDGTKFDGPATFRKVLMEQREAFIMTLTEKLLTYGLGRGAEYYDMPAVRKIMRDAASRDYRWSAIIMGIVRSTPFQMRRSES